MAPVLTKTSGGEEIVILSRTEYETLVSDREDAEDAAVARARLSELEHGLERSLSPAELERYLDAPTPVAFWRESRSLDLATVASAAQLSPEEMQNIGIGRANPDRSTLARLAAVLKVRIQDLS